jgi:hypothetical protein
MFPAMEVGISLSTSMKKGLKRISAPIHWMPVMTQLWMNLN